MTTLGENIRIGRRIHDLSQAELARKLGVTKQAVSYWETGAREPDLETIRALARALDLALADLVETTPSASLPPLHRGEFNESHDEPQPKPHDEPTFEGGIPMNKITLDDLLAVAAAKRLSVTVTLTRTLTARLDVDSADLGQWTELVELYGGYEVREVTATDFGTLGISLTPPTRLPKGA